MAISTRCLSWLKGLLASKPDAEVKELVEEQEDTELTQTDREELLSWTKERFRQLTSGTSDKQYTTTPSTKDSTSPGPPLSGNLLLPPPATVLVSSSRRGSMRQPNIGSSFGEMWPDQPYQVPIHYLDEIECEEDSLASADFYAEAREDGHVSPTSLPNKTIVEFSGLLQPTSYHLGHCSINGKDFGHIDTVIQRAPSDDVELEISTSNQATLVTIVESMQEKVELQIVCKFDGVTRDSLDIRGHIVDLDMTYVGSPPKCKIRIHPRLITTII